MSIFPDTKKFEENMRITAPLHQEIAELRAKLTAAEKDAERWRKCVDVCHGHSDEHGDFVVVQLPAIDGPFSSTEEMFIATIDAAIAKEKE